MPALCPTLHLLTLVFHAARFLISFTLARITTVLLLLPLHLWKVALLTAPALLRNFPALLTPHGRERLLHSSESSRTQYANVAKRQEDGTYTFPPSAILPTENQHKDEIRARANWFPQLEKLTVCGISVAVVHELPPPGEKKNGTVVLLHGNPGWSYTWRTIIPVLTSRGFEVLAVDWIGHGLSDKPLDPRGVTYNLHVRTLLALFEEYKPTDAWVVAHDWGGCIALGTIPLLPRGACAKLMLVNSFFPPKLEDVSFRTFLLYASWYLTASLLLVRCAPEWVVMRLMTPTISMSVARGYSAPYDVTVERKASIVGFTQTMPTAPDFLLSFRDTEFWGVMEGLLGPEQFAYLNMQAGLARRDREMREYWRRYDRVPEVMVVFGRNDPLVELKGVLEATVSRRALVRAENEGWVQSAGHYPMEEKPEAMTEAVRRFVEDVSERAKRR